MTTCFFLVIACFLVNFGRSRSFSGDSDEVKLVIFGEGRCRDTSYFFKWHLMPMYRLYGSTGRISIEYHPFGVKSSCVEGQNGVVSCLCHHGERECGLNQLQACVIDALPNFDDYIFHVDCIQGRENITDAADSCLHNPEFKQKMLACGQSNKGRQLVMSHEKVQHELAPNIDWVPWISINGERLKAAEEDLWQLICDRYLSKPRPQQCPKTIHFN